MTPKTLFATALVTATIGLSAVLSGAATAEPLLMDEFDGDSLQAHWEVLNEDPDSYIVENGQLLLIGTSGGQLKKGDVPNIMRLKADLPQGDWVATIKFSVPYQTGREAPFIGIYEDGDNHLVTTTNAWSYYEGIRGARMFLSSWKRSGGNEASFNKVIWGGASGEAFSAEQAPNPILLRITKKGRTYTPAYLLEGMKQTEWIEHEKLTSLRPKGKLAIGIYQLENVNGETPMAIDWFKIEALN